MKGALLVALMLAASAPAQVQSPVWRESKLSFTAPGGSTVLEWISPTAVRVSRFATFPPIQHDPVLAAFEDGKETLSLRSRSLSVEVNRASGAIIIAREGAKVRILATGNDGTEIQVDSSKKSFGDPSTRFYFHDGGWGWYAADSRSQWNVDAASARTTGPCDFVIYFGPAPKTVLEQHQVVIASPEVTEPSLSLLTKAQLPAPAKILPSWDGPAGLVRGLNQASLGATLYPAFDLASMDAASPAMKQRALDLAAILPLIFRSSGRTNVAAATRTAFVPYLTTYLREAYDRGLPLIRPFQIQFPKDASSWEHPNEFMLGDEFLVAPVIEAGNRRRVSLPRGRWTDLRTNTEYAGNQSIEIEAPPGRVPMFARNGSLFPLAVGNRMELHYMPALGGEFFLWETGLKTISQFHAAPAGEFLRVEIETKIPRTYEWVLHHTGLPREVGEDSGVYKKVSARRDLKPGTWWHDSRANNLHFIVRAEAGTDRIVNVSF